MAKAKTKETDQRSSIIHAAIDLYLEDKTKYNMRNVAMKLEIEPAVVYKHFPTKEAILKAFYKDLVKNYQEMTKEIEDFASYTLAEKMQNFAYASFDMLSEQREFFNHTFDKMVLKQGTSKGMGKDVKAMLKHWISEDEHIADSAQPFIGSFTYEFLTKEYFHLLHFWKTDESEDAERTVALTDKLTTLVEEIFYSKIVDRSIDTVKYIFQQSGFSFRLFDSFSCDKKS